MTAGDPPRLPPPDDWGEEVEDDPDSDWPSAPPGEGDGAWPDPGIEPLEDEDPWDPERGPLLDDLAWPGEDAEEALPEDAFAHRDPRQELPRGRLVLAVRERVGLPDLGLDAVPAECHTGAATSRLAGRWETVEDGASVRIGDHAVAVPLLDPSPPRVALLVEIAGLRLPARLHLDPADGPIHLILGRDLLAGRFVVDVPESGEG